MFDEKKNADSVADPEDPKDQDADVPEGQRSEKEKPPTLVKMTQEELNNMIKDRLARQKESLLRDAGIDRDWKEILKERSELLAFRQEYEEQQKKAEEAEALKRGEHERIIDQLRKVSDERQLHIDTLKKQLEDTKQTLNERNNSFVVQKILGESFAAAGGLPAAVKHATNGMLEEAKFVVDEEFNVSVRDKNGNKLFEDAQEQTVETWVKWFLDKYPHFRSSPTTKGSGIEPGFSSDGRPLTIEAKRKIFKDLTDKGMPTDKAFEQAGLPT